MLEAIRKAEVAVGNELAELDWDLRMEAASGASEIAGGPASGEGPWLQTSDLAPSAVTVTMQDSAADART